MTYDEIKAAWNAQADEHNQWDDLGEEEKIEWAASISAAKAPRVPLSKSEVDGLLESAGYLYNGNTRADFTSGIRYAEIHHGITREQQG